MSNFSNVGFKVTVEQDYYQLIDKVYKVSSPVKVNGGTYFIYTDDSGAELYIQVSNKNECIGVNPHFKGKSKRTVCLTNSFQRPESELDGAFHCWADPTEENNPDSGVYPFVFDLPDSKTIGQMEFPKNVEIQLAAFAQELHIYQSEKEYFDSQTTEMKLAAQSFIPSGLFSVDEENGSNPPKAFGFFTGIIKAYERKTNLFTGEAYYWLLVDTLGGEVDVVAELKYFEKEPSVNGVVQGQFWLSGKLINPPANQVNESKTLFQRLFGR